MPNTGKVPKVKAPTPTLKIKPIVGSHNIHNKYLTEVSPKVSAMIEGMFQSDNTTMLPVKTSFKNETKKIAAAKSDLKEKAQFAFGGMMPLLAGYGAGTITGDIIAPRAYKAITKKPLNLSPRARMAMGVLSALAMGGAHALRLKKNTEKKNVNKKRKHSRKNRLNPAKVSSRESLARGHEGYTYTLPKRSLQPDDFGGVQIRARKGPIYDGNRGGGDGDNNNRRDDDRYTYRRKAPRYHRFS